MSNILSEFWFSHVPCNTFAFREVEQAEARPWHHCAACVPSLHLTWHLGLLPSLVKCEPPCSRTATTYLVMSQKIA
eukprot:740348-Amphidinium_carterae.1